MHKIESTLLALIQEKVIPDSGLFDITESSIAQYIVTYQRLFGKGNTRYDVMFARKLAGLNLLDLKLSSRGGTHLNCKEGILYFIKNPAWPDYLKVGITTNIKSRLSTYQTGDPRRLYSVAHYEFVLDRRKAERDVLAEYKIDITTGEWIGSADAILMMDSLRKKWSLPQGNRTGV